jgi:hypothetical protein
MKLKRPNKSGNQPTNQGYPHPSPKISGDANSGTRVGFGGNVGGENPVGGANNIYLKDNAGIGGDSNSGTQVGFGGNVGGVNPVGGVNDIYLPENQKIAGGANDNIYLKDNQEV